MEAYIGGAWRSISSGDVRIDGQWRRLVRCEAYVGGAWRTGKTFLGALTLTAPSEVYALGVGTVTTEAITATPSGGLAPYAYAWTRTSGSHGFATAPSAATTAFIATPPGGSIQISVFRCTVTDSLGASATADTTVTFEELGIS